MVETGTDDRLTWRRLQRQATSGLRSAGLDDPAGDARRLVQRASGRDGAAEVLGLGDHVPRRAVAHLDAMVARRAGGEPLQYVVGRWGFRSLDLLVDRRVLIPRPETEQVTEAAIDELRRMGAGGRPVTAVDLGTGSGAIALSLAVEVPTATVWATDRSAAALAVARANLAGLGRPAVRVRLAEGDWFSALPVALRGAVDVVVANPPYVPRHTVLPASVEDWEPAQALRSGVSGLEDLATIVAGAPGWLNRHGALVLEVAPDQAPAAVDLAVRAGFADVAVRPDLAGRDRAVIARQ